MKRKASYERKQRNTGRRKKKRILLISAEGVNKTEQNYFSYLAGRRLSVQFAGGNETDPVHLARHLRDSFNEYALTDEDLAVCFVDADFDTGKNEQIQAAEKIIGRLGSNARLIVSCPCFEVWFICHYTYTTRHFTSSNDVISFLRRYIPDYTKAGRSFYTGLTGKVHSAVRNARALERYCEALHLRPHTVEFTPSTEAYTVVEWMYSFDG